MTLTVVGSQPAAADSAIRRVTWLGMAVNLILAVLKVGAGLLGRSQAVIADGFHSLADLISDIAIIVGLRYWARPPDRTHPYGHGRIETLVAVGLGVFLILVSCSIAYRAIIALGTETTATPRPVALFAALLSLVSKELLYHWTVRVGRRTGSTAVVMNAWHHRSDALSSLPAVIAVAVAVVYPRWGAIDRIGALIIAGVILVVAVRLLRAPLSELADSGGTRREVERITDIVRQVPGVRSLHALRSRRWGGGLLVDLHIQVDGEMSVREGHEISEQVKRAILERGPGVRDVVVHLEPEGEGIGDKRGDGPDSRVPAY